MACSADGKKIAAAGDNGAVTVWDLPSGTLLLTLGKDLQSDDAVAFSPDGRYVMGATQSRHILSWLKSGGPLFNLYEGHDLSVTSLAVSPAGKYLVSGGMDGAIRV